MRGPVTVALEYTPKSKPKGYRRVVRRCLCGATMMLFFGALLLMCLRLISDADSAQGQAAQMTDGAISAPSSWQLVRERVMAGGESLLATMGLSTVLSAEERDKVTESLKESGDDDHEAEVVQSVPTPPTHPFTSTPSDASQSTSDPSSLSTAAASSLSPLSTSAAAAAVGHPSSGGGATTVALAPPAKTLGELSPLFVNVTVERVPLAGYSGVDGVLSISDGSCRVDCLPHGICVKRRCLCTISYTGDACRTGKRILPKQRSLFDGRYVLSVRSVKKSKGVRYPLVQSTELPTTPIGGQKSNADGQGVVNGQPVVFDAPLFTAGKMNRVVWTHLQKEKLLDLDPMLSQALLDFIPSSDLLLNSLFNRCAIVGNSGFNLLFRHGREIDAHDAVIRIYDAPTRAPGSRGQILDYSPYVGRRTTLRLLDEQLVGWSEADEVRIMNVASKAGFYNYFQSMSRQPDAKSFLFDPEFTAFVTDRIGPTPSPLAFAIFLALQKCRSLSLFGVHWKPGYGVPELYYRTTDADANIEFDQSQEAQLIESLARSSLASVQQPCVVGCEAESRVPCLSCAPGSACACGRHNPLPVALPGFCHLPGNYSCFYLCEPDVCKGGPGNSLCPKEMNMSGQKCATSASVSKSARESAWWAVRGSMREFDVKFERAFKMLRKKKAREAKEAARKERLIRRARQQRGS